MGKETKDVVMTTHAKQRGRKRTGNKATEKMFKKALEKGLKLEDTSGQLYKYMEKRCKNDNDVRIYGEFIYIFCPIDNKLITLYIIPNEFKALVKRLLGRKV